MRVTHNSVFDVAKMRLGTLVEEYNEANRVVTTGKRINRLSDDPVGISSVVNLRSNLANLEQLSENINTARTWLTAAETSLQSIEGLLEDAKVLALTMRNDTITAVDRESAAIQIRETLDQVLDFANTQVNGQYLFSGTRTDTKPFEFDDPDNPTGIIYSGNNDSFTLKTGKDTNMAVGYDGSDLFDSEHLTVDDTNNMIDFMEDTGTGFGVELTATIAHGTYTRDELATAIENAMRTASSASGASADYDVFYDSTTEQFTLWDDGSTLTGLRLLFANGTNTEQSIAPDIGFVAADVDDTVPLESDDPVDWGLFRTLFDFRDYLENNDSSGIERSMSWLDTQFENMVNEVSKIGYKGLSLDVKTTVIEDLNLTYEGQKSEIEDADIIEAITTFQAKQNAYQAALSSTAKVMQLSLLDYL